MDKCSILPQTRYALSLSNTNPRLKQQHTWTLPHPFSPCAPEILHKNYVRELAFSLWLSLHLHEIIFLITLSLVIFIFAKIQSKSNGRMTWNDLPAPLALGLVILLPIIFMCSTCSSSCSYILAALLLLLAFCVVGTKYALSKQHGKDGSSCNGLNLNAQQRQRQVKKGGKEVESKPKLISQVVFTSCH